RRCDRTRGARGARRSGRANGCARSPAPARTRSGVRLAPSSRERASRGSSASPTPPPATRPGPEGARRTSLPALEERPEPGKAAAVAEVDVAERRERLGARAPPGLIGVETGRRAAGGLLPRAVRGTRGGGARAVVE